MAQNKTVANEASVDAFLGAIENDKKRSDAQAIYALMCEIAGEEGRMWGSSIVGFGEYHYTYASGREGNFMRVGFSPRKRNLVLYIMPGFGAYDGLLAKLGKHKTGKSCLYINKLADVDTGVLRELVQRSLEHMAEKYPQ